MIGLSISAAMAGKADKVRSANENRAVLLTTGTPSCPDRYAGNGWKLGRVPPLYKPVDGKDAEQTEAGLRIRYENRITIRAYKSFQTELRSGKHDPD